MSTLIFYSAIDRGPDWEVALKREIPELVFRDWDEPGNDADVTFALVWKPPAGALRARFPNLRAIVSLGAGVDHIFADPDLPPGVPVIRMIDPGLRQGMIEYALLHVLALHRRAAELREAQAKGRWVGDLFTPLAQDTDVSVLGLGVLGGAIAQALAQVGYRVRGWSRTPKDMPGIACHHGADGLGAALDADIVVSVLPMTPATRGILNADLFARMRPGAGLINMGRGGQQVEADIVAALDSGQLSRVVLDVFQTEPLPQGHPFWAHPCVTVTPHNAAITQPGTAARVVGEAIRAVLQGREPANVVDPGAGY